MRINFNQGAAFAQNQLRQTGQQMGRSLERLGSGLRINRASDDAAGLSVSEELRTQVRGTNQAKRNADDAMSLLKVAEGAMNESHSILQRQRELAIQAANDTLTDADRAYLQEEFAALNSELTRINDSTQFNGIQVLKGGADNADELIADLRDDWIPDAIATVEAAYSNLTASGNLKVSGENMDGLAGRLATGGTDGTQAVINLDLDDFNADVTGGDADGTMNHLAAKFTAQDILIHEMTHALQFTNGHYPPTWFSEGAAEASNQAGADRVTTLLGSYGSIDAIINASSFASIGGSINHDAWSGSDADYATAYLAAMYIQDNGTSINDVYGGGAITGSASLESKIGAQFGGLFSNFETAFLTSGAAANSGPVIAEQDGSTITGEGFSGVTWDIGEALQMQIGANDEEDVDTMDMDGLGSISASALGTEYSSVANQAAATASIGTVDSAIETVSSKRSDVGALINRLEHTLNNLNNQETNTQDAESRIRDVDFAQESTQFSRTQILQNSATSMLSQANAVPQSILSLIG